MEHEQPQTAADWKTSVGYAGFFARVLASIIDTVVLLVPITLVLGVIYQGLFAGDDLSPQDVALIAEQARLSAQPVETFFSEMNRTGMLERRLTINLLINGLLAVAVLLLWNRYAATPGKMVLKMRIVDADTGREPSNKQNFGRYMGYFVSTAAMCLGFVVIAFSKRKQGWHDKMANTVVVYTDSLPEELGGSAKPAAGSSAEI